MHFITTKPTHSRELMDRRERCCRFHVTQTTRKHLNSQFFSSFFYNFTLPFREIWDDFHIFFLTLCFSPQSDYTAALPLLFRLLKIKFTNSRFDVVEERVRDWGNEQSFLCMNEIVFFASWNVGKMREKNHFFSVFIWVHMSVSLGSGRQREGSVAGQNLMCWSLE